MKFIKINYIKELNNFCISDISNIIYSYGIEKYECFNYEFVNECIETGNYNFIDTSNISLVHWLFAKSNTKLVRQLLNNASNMRVEHFQNKDRNGATELYWICSYRRMYNIIIRIQGLERHHFNNKAWFPAIPYTSTEFKVLQDNENDETIKFVETLCRKKYNDQKYVTYMYGF